MLYRIPKCCSWHGFRMSIKKTNQYLPVYPFPYFAKHPSDGFMHEIMFVAKQSLCDVECHFFISFFDLIETRKYNHTIHPEIFACNTFIYKSQTCFMRHMFTDIWTDNMLTRHVYQIPVVDSFFLHRRAARRI